MDGYEEETVVVENDAMDIISAENRKRPREDDELMHPDSNKTTKNIKIQNLAPVTELPTGSQNDFDGGIITMTTVGDIAGAVSTSTFATTTTVNATTTNTLIRTHVGNGPTKSFMSVSGTKQTSAEAIGSSAMNGQLRLSSFDSTSCRVSSLPASMYSNYYKTTGPLCNDDAKESIDPAWEKEAFIVGNLSSSHRNMEKGGIVINERHDKETDVDQERKKLQLDCESFDGDTFDTENCCAQEVEENKVHPILQILSAPAFQVKVVLGLSVMFMLNTLLTIRLLSFMLMPSSTITFVPPRHHPHVIPPSIHAHVSYHRAKNNIYRLANILGTNNMIPSKGLSYQTPLDRLSNVTLRQFLSHPDGFHLGIAPAFFGFYVYFGVLTAFQEHVLTDYDKKQGKILLPSSSKVIASGKYCSTMDYDKLENSSTLAMENTCIMEPLLKSVAGASAGAMAAVLLAAGLDPRENAKFATTMTLDKFWDFPGYGGVIKGDLFEKIMIQRLKESRITAADMNKIQGLLKDGVHRDQHNVTESNVMHGSINLENGLIPVAVTAFDILHFSKIVLTRGCMGKAARASATFPGLFQPCGWKDSDKDINTKSLYKSDKYRYLMDGGIWDRYGLEGLGHLRVGEQNKRVVNLVAGSYGIQGPPSPTKMPKTLHTKEVLSLSIQNTPQCGPWAMQNGPRAVEAAMNAIVSVLDVPLYHGQEEGHYILNVDATAFVNPIKNTDEK